MPMHLYEDESLAQEVYQEENDVQFARKVEQELHDEELARQLARAEERALAAEERARGPPPTRPWTMKRVCSYVVPLVIVVLGVVALLYAMRSDKTQTIPNISFGGSFFEDEDPWQGLKPGDVVRWNNGGAGGLELQVVDALESQWEDIFHAVVEDWDSGTPKVLKLATQKAGPDPDCEPIDNKSKVCNSDYGDTQWRGINQVLIQNGYIISTTSKMNEYYLKKSSEAQKRYTMCHEIGHSFGLPHSDEDFFNADLGNCMDYTSNPAANISPDESNFKFLADLYGTVPARRTRRGLVQAQQAPPVASSRPSSSSTSIPDAIRQKLKDVVPRLENRAEGNAHEDGWRLLHSSSQGESHAMSLGNGWSVEMHKLSPFEE